jgi:two-component system response regulator MtrA
LVTRFELEGATRGRRDRPLVLTADDDPAIRKIVSRVLELNDFEVRACKDGAEALQAFEDAQPELVILDMKMPVVDGLTVCREIRAESDVPIHHADGR